MLPEPRQPNGENQPCRPPNGIPAGGRAFSLLDVASDRYDLSGFRLRIPLDAEARPGSVAGPERKMVARQVNAALIGAVLGAVPAVAALGQDAVGSHATTHVVVTLPPGVEPATHAQGAITLRARGVGAGLTPDPVAAALAQWNVNSITPVFENGFANAALAAQLGLDRRYRVNVPAGTNTPQMVAQLVAFGDVIERCELDGVGGTAATIPGDSDFGLQWSLLNTGQSVQGSLGTPGADVGATAAWDITTGDPDIVLAVLDAGMDPHVDLVKRMIPGRNVAASPDNDDTSDVCISHGTHVAGIAAASGDNDEGIAGVDWAVQIMPVRVLNSCAGTESQLAEGLIWATDHGADVINMSLQYYTGTQTLLDAVAYAHAAGVIMVAAAGNNEGCPAPPGTAVAYPARWSQTIAVAATNNQDLRAGLSNCGPQIDLAAPGQGIWSLRDIVDYQYLTGTSMAAPHVAGAITLLLSLDGSVTKEAALKLLQDTALDIELPGPDVKTGAGRLDVHAAMAAVQSSGCPWDLDDSNSVDAADFLELIAQWGTNPVGPPDFDGNGNVDVVDFLTLLESWGPCPQGTS